MRRIGLITFLFALVALLPATSRAESLVIGTIDSNIEKAYKEFDPLAQYLLGQLKNQGIDDAKVFTASSMEDMVTALKDGRIDLYFDSPIIAMLVNEAAGSRQVLRRWKSGVGSYKTVIVARQDAGITTLADLKGKVIAFEEPFSSSGFLLPMLILGEEGLVLKEGKSPGPDEVGYVFSGDDENSLVWVTRKKVDAAAFSNGYFAQAQQKSKIAMTIIAETFEIPRQVVNLRAGIADDLAARIIDVLKAMDTTEEGKAVLKAFKKTAKFDDIPATDLSRLEKSKAAFVDLLQAR